MTLTLRSKIRHDNSGSGLAVYKYNLNTPFVPQSSSLSKTYSTIYSDAQENYVDADYNLGNLRVCTSTTSAGASVTLNNTEDSYKNKEGDTTYDIKVTLREGKYLTDSSDYICRLAYLNIFKKEDGQPDSAYVDATSSLKYGSKGYTFNSDEINNDGSITVLQKFSKAQSTDTIDGIKYSKDSQIYFFKDKYGKSEYVLGKSDSDSSKRTGANAGGKTQITTSSQNILSSIYLDTTGSRIYAETITPKTKDSFNYIDVSSYDESDTDSTASGIVKAGGCPRFINNGYIMTWDQNKNFIKAYKTDPGISSISVDSKDNMIAWDENKGVYVAIHNVKPATTTDTATTIVATTTGSTVTIGAAVTTGNANTTTGWVLNKNNTWNYILENGINKTGWLNNTEAWYYLKADGVMATGSVNDNGTWYYCNSLGAMLSNTSKNAALKFNTSL